jgi:hypothetical protein
MLLAFSIGTIIGFSSGYPFQSRHSPGPHIFTVLSIPIRQLLNFIFSISLKNRLTFEMND